MPGNKKDRHIIFGRVRKKRRSVRRLYGLHECTGPGRLYRRHQALDNDYLVIDAGLVGGATGNSLNTEDFVADYRTGNDITSDTKRKAYGKLASFKGTDDEIEYFAIGTLDVEASELDEKTGNHRVAVAVTGEVWSVFQRGATVAEVGPVTMIGEGPTELVAKNNALTAAARRAASDLVAKLSARNIR